MPSGWELYGIVNLAAFALMGIDKLKAKYGRWRISEATLLLVALVGGGGGAYLGMLVFRHKTRKGRFRYGLPLLAAIQLFAVYLLAF